MRSAREPGFRRRSTDWFEDAVAWLLSAAAVLGLGVALAVGLSQFATASDRARVEAATSIPVRATLVDDAASESVTGMMPLVQVPAGVTWTGPDGTPRRGSVAVAAGARAGTTVPVWLTRDGVLTGAPTTPAEAIGVGVGAGLTVVLVDGCVIVAAWPAARRLALALNARAWEREWRRVEPLWSRASGER